MYMYEEHRRSCPVYLVAVGFSISEVPGKIVHHFGAV